MRPIQPFTAPLLLAVVLFLTGCESTPKDPHAALLGEWNMSTQVGEQVMTGVMAVSKDGETLSGTWTSPDGETAMGNLVFEKGQLKFTRQVGTHHAEFEGKVKKGKVEGVYTVEALGQYDCTGVRVAVPETPEAQ